MVKPWVRDTAALAVILLLSLVLFRNSILYRQIYYEPDTVTFYYPVMSAVDRAVEQGAIPLWTPYIFGGFPLFADGEAGMLYPFNLLLTWLMPIQDAFIWLRILRFFLAGAFTYAFVRSIGRSRVGSLMAGLVFAFGSFMVAQLQHTNVGNSAIWLPLILCFVELALRAKGYRRQMFLLLSGAAFGAQNLGVHVQPVLMTWLALSLYAAFRVLLTDIGCAVGKGSDIGFSAARFIGAKVPLLLWIIGLITAIGFGLAAVQLLPLYELGTFSSRDGGVSYSFATLYSLPLYNLATLIFPYFFVRPDGSTWSLWVQWESTVYVGIAPLVLALVAVCFYRMRLVFFFAFLALMSLLLSFGDYLPVQVYWVLWHLPGFSVLRVPARFSYLFVFSCAVLASFGLEWLSFNIGKAHPERYGLKSTAQPMNRAHVIVLGAFAAFIGLLVLTLLYARHWIVDNKGAALQVINESYLGLRKHNFSLSAENVYDSLDYSLNLANTKTGQSMVFLIVVLALILLWHRFRSRSGIWQGGLIFVLAADLMLFAADFHPTIPIESLSAPSKAIRFLTDRSGLYRVYNGSPGMRTEPNQLLPFKVASVGGYSSLETRRYKEYKRAIERGNKRLLDLLNVRFVIAWAGQAPGGDYKVAYQDGDIVLYENNSFLPRAFLVESAAVVSPRQPALDRLESGDFNPSTTVILEEPFDPTVLFGGPRLARSGKQIVDYDDQSPNNKVEVLDYRREVVTIQAEAYNNSFLVLADAYYPGWKAYVDGQEVHIYRADYLFRGVYLPAGSHKVQFVFEPSSFEIGRAISIATLMVVVAAIGFGVFFNSNTFSKASWRDIIHS